ncbi:MAG: ribonuclease P protein component [Candidatus Brocadiia bacterium]
MKANGFSRQERLINNRDFQKVFKEGRRLSNDLLFVHTLPNGLDYCRLGLAIGKMEVHLAVWRNRIKRLLRESFRLNKPAPEPKQGWDIVVRLRYDRAVVHNTKLDVSERKLDAKIKALKLSEVQKSMVELMSKSTGK